MSTKYVIDACALINASKHYNMSKSTFSAIWDKIGKMADNGELITSSEIVAELKDDDLIKWTKQHSNMIIPLTREIQELVVEVLKRYPTLIKLKSSANSNGDPFLIATALCTDGAAIITDEIPGDERSKDFHIPNVCKGFGIPYINMRDFLDTILE